jgi:phosphate transport system substrate-binding protein
VIEGLDRRSFMLLGTAVALSARSRRPLSLISLVGYNDMAEMLTALSAAFMKHHPAIRVAADLPGTRFGPAALAGRRSTLAPMGARFTPEQDAAFLASTGGEPAGFRVAHASLSPKALSGPNALFVNHSNSLEEIDLAVAARLFTMPGPHRWSEVQSAGALGQQLIALAGLAPATPLALEFREAVFPSKDFATRYERFGQSRDVIAFIGQEPAALGFAALNRGNDKVRVLAIRRGASSPAVFPDADTLRAGTYPLDRHLWIYARRGKDRRLEPLARAYLEFVLSREGQAIIGSGTLGYLPLGEDERRAELAKLSG